MMDGYELYQKAYLRLGFENGDEITLNSRKLLNALELINQISADLKIKTISSLSEKIIATDEQCEALCLGVTMLIALCEGDIPKNKLFAEIYNAKRAAVLGEIAYIEDKLPKGESGEV